MFPMPDKEQAVIIRAIAYSGRPDWRDLLEKTSPRTPLRRPLIDDFLAGKRPTLMELPLDTGGSPGIYALWGYYVATGQYEPVVRIMQALRWSKRKGDSGFSFRKVFTGWGSDPSAIDKITTGGTAKWTLASYAERDRALLALYRAEYARQPEDIAVPLKDVIDAAEIFESEKVRKDQFGAIEDAQRAQMTNKFRHDQGRDGWINRHRDRLRGGERARPSLYRAALRARWRALHRRRQARALRRKPTRCRGE